MSGPQLEQQLLHRKRTGVTEGLTKEQKRLHLASKMLQEFCDASTRHPGGGGGGGAAFSGSNLVR